MSRFSLPIIVWVVLGLALVAALPIMAAWFQIERNLGSIIRQTQQTHQVIARATADRLAGRIDVFERLIEAAADDPSIYQDPASQEAGDALLQVFQGLDDALALSLLVRQDGEDLLLFSAKAADERLAPLDHIAEVLDPEPSLRVRNGRYLLRVQIQTTRPGTFLHLLAEIESVAEIPTPELGEDAHLILVDSNTGEIIDGDRYWLQLIPETMRQAMSMDPINAANNSFRDGETPVVYGFAKVGDLPMRVVSIQPARAAEVATSEINRTAFVTVLGVLIAVLVLSVGAWFMVVRPIREIVAAGHALVGGAQGAGGDLAQLRFAFEKLENALRERDALSEVFLGRYQIIRRLGSGAMGTVYLAWDPKLERHVALKTIKLSDDLPKSERQEMTQALFQEARLAAQLIHPNVVVVYDVLGDEDHAFLTMEYVEGVSLDYRISQFGPLEPALLVAVVRGILRGLAAAHAKEVIHRDIKPANVMMGVDDTVKVSDFGIAGVLKHVTEGENVVMGTPGYLAPESYRTGAYNVRTDLFAVGVLIVECLTGKPVFAGRNTAQVIVRTQAKEIMLDPETEAKLPPSMVHLIRALLMKDSADRPSSANAALAMIADIPDTVSGDTEKNTESAEGNEARHEVSLDHSNLATRRDI